MDGECGKNSTGTPVSWADFTGIEHGEYDKCDKRERKEGRIRIDKNESANDRVAGHLRFHFLAYVS